ncbi:MAG: Signal transduction histidine-protein kinase BarA [Bacteroidetes bacterium]|nr:MAG: Signal transduction histidine-protein kinase BarA [Bacteroidota bacterium]
MAERIPDTLYILMIDDDEEDYIITADIMKSLGRQRYVVDWEPSFSKALENISQDSHDVYLVDYRLGAENGLELISQAILNGSTSPFILLTGQDDEEVDAMALRAGASDYLVKDGLNRAMLERSIRYSLAQAKALDEISQLNASLEKKVQDRTMVLEEALHELEKSKEELNKALSKERELNEMKSRFVSMASHEFRTPLATILSSLSLVSRYIEQGQEEQRNKHIGRIKSSVSNMTDILNDFLSVSKLEEGRVECKPETTDITAFISDVVQAMKINASEDQEIIYKHSGPEKEIFIDPMLLKNVLFNLVSNAIKFTVSGGTIRITSKTGNRRLEITVADQGIGISQEDQAHLFERFFRGGNVTHIQGTGLGLSIVARYVELMNGKIRFESELNKGTTFILNFALP